MTFPSALAAIRAYLDGRAVAAGDPVRTFGGVPNPRPARFVRLQQVGDTTRSVAHRDVRVVVESWEATEDAAERLADLVHGWLCDMDTPGGHVPQGPAGWLGGPYTQPDPITGSPRYGQTVILRQRRQ